MLNVENILSKFEIYWNTYLHITEKVVKRFDGPAGIFIIFFIVGYVLKKIFERLAHKFSKNNKKFGWYSFFKSLTVPIFLLFIFVGGVVAFRDAYPKIKTVVSFREVGLILFFVWVSISYINAYEDRYLESKQKGTKKIDKKTVDVVVKFSKALVVLVAILWIMHALKVDVRGIWTVAGIGSIAIAFASKGMLENILGTIVLYVDKPFSIGDYIRLSDGTEGTAEFVGWRVTKIRPFTNDSLYIVPNSTFLTVFIKNYSKKTHWCIRHIVSLRYKDAAKLPAITQEIKDMLIIHPKIDSEEMIRVTFSDFSDSAIMFEVIALIDVYNDMELYLKVRQEVMLNVEKIIRKHKAKLAFRGLDMSECK